VGHTAENLAITALASARAPSDPAAVQVLVTVHNFGSAAHTTSLELLRDAAIVGRESIALAPRSSRAVTFAIRDAPASLRSPLPDEIHARLTMNDALAADNERWGLIPPNTPVRVRLITHGSTFLERALAANPGITLDVSHAPDLDAAARDTHDADVLVCGGCRSLPARGPAVLIIPDAPADPPRVLDSLSLTGATHAVTSDVDFTGLAARPLPRIAGTSGGETLARAGDVPAVIVSDHDGRRLVELNLDLSSSTLPLNVSFPLLLANAIDWLSARSEQNRSVTAGDPLVWAPADSPAQASAIGPGGRTIPVQVAGQTVIVTDTSMAGVYRVRAGNAERDFAVNPATETESDLSMPSTGHDDNAASAPRVSPLRRDDHIDRSGALPSALLIVALLLLAIEWRQFCRGAR
jgi:hypothetical protein